MPLPGVPAPLQRRAVAAAAWLREQQEQGRCVTVVHHIDADGVAAGAVARRCLESAGIRHTMLAAKSLDDVHVAKVHAAAPEALWFCDFGSTVYMRWPDTPRLVCDHHELVRDGTEEHFPHVNPLLDDLPGDSVSGAGCAYLVAAAFDAQNAAALAPLALVGASGDLQDRRGGFTGTNRAILTWAETQGVLDIQQDLTWYGSETRSLSRFLQRAREPSVPGLDRAALHELLEHLDIPLEHEGKERTWAQLAPDERHRLRSALVDRMLDAGVPGRDVAALIGEVVRINGEQPSTPVRELREFATLLNSTARYGRPEVGLAVACGDRDEALKEALGLLDGHRKHLASAIRHVAQAGVQERDALQWVHVEDRVHDTVVGTVCGMALEGLGLRRDLPIVGFAYTPDGRTKVSTRAPEAIQGRVDLATAVRASAESVEGQGGGHKGAAGATIPRGTETAFLDTLEAQLAAQLGIKAAPAAAGRMLKGQATLF